MPNTPSSSCASSATSRPATCSRSSRRARSSSPARIRWAPTDDSARRIRARTCSTSAETPRSSSARRPKRRSRCTASPAPSPSGRSRAAARGIASDLDARREAALHLDEKETAEHMMLVDLARNDVARVSRPGTRRVTRLLTVDRYAHVMHLVSEVQGELAPGLDALHAYAAAMNMGTLVGAPKIRAAAILRDVEPSRRGAYGGAVGYLTHDGAMDTAIVIRAAVVRDGIVVASPPDTEAREPRHKAEAVLRAVAGADADA